MENPIKSFVAKMSMHDGTMLILSLDVYDDHFKIVEAQDAQSTFYQSTANATLAIQLFEDRQKEVFGKIAISVSQDDLLGE